MAFNPNLTDEQKKALETLGLFPKSIRQEPEGPKLPELPKDAIKRLERLKIVNDNYAPNYSGKPLRLLMIRRFGNMPVILDQIDVPILAESAQFKGMKQYIVDPKLISMHSHKDRNSWIFYDVDKNLPYHIQFVSAKDEKGKDKELFMILQEQDNSQSSDLMAIYGFKENFRQFIMGIRQEIARNTRQVAVLAIIMFIVGALVGHFI